MLPTLSDIFKVKGEVRLTEKMKGLQDCHCSLCKPNTSVYFDGGKVLNVRVLKIAIESINQKKTSINDAHFAAIKLFIPKLSKSRFKLLQKTLEESSLKKDVHEMQQKRHSALRLYPLPSEVYNKFANYIYKKFGEPQFKKKKQNIDGANWGPSMMVNWHSQKHGMWVHKRTFGVGIHRSAFRFYVDHDTYYLPKDKKDKGRKLNPGKFKR